MLETLSSTVVQKLSRQELREIILIVSPEGNMIRDYFDNSPSLAGENQYIIQPEAKGLGDAIYCRESVGNELF